MTIILTNRLGCVLHTWESIAEFVRDLQRGYTVLADGDTLTVSEQ